jgi:muramidase (phage lysozyme)
MSIEEGAQRGREVIALRAEAAAAQARYERAQSDDKMSNEDRDRETRASAQTMVSTVISSFGRRVDPYIANFEAAIAAAGTNAEDQAALGEGRIAMMAGISAARRGAIVDLSAVGAQPDAVKQVNDFFDAQEAALDRLFDTSFEQNTAASRSLAAGLGIEMGRALPIYGRISSALGQARANALIEDLTSGAPGLSTEMIEAARAELMNFDPTSARGTMSLARSIAYLEQKEGLRDFTAAEAPGLVRQNTRALAAVTGAILAGAESQLPGWEQSFGNTLEATSELSPATATGDSLWRASNTFATAASRRVLAMSIRENPEFGNALAMASRATAAHVINVATSVPSDSMYTVEYYPETRNYQPYLSREAYDAWAVQQRGTAALRPSTYSSGIPTIRSYEEMRRSANIPEDIRQRVGAANNAIQHLIATDQYDENVRGLSAIERANLYGAGRTPASMANRGASPTAASETRRLRDIATQGAQEFLGTTLATPRTPDTNTRNPARIMNYEAAEAGFTELPPEVRTLGDVSDFQLSVNRAGVASSAAGTYQIVGQTLRGRNNENGYAERVFGANWRDVEWTEENQDRIAEAIFNDHKNSAEALSRQWVSLSREEAERVRQMPWSQARRIIAQGESG